jgi:hypothetical protein
MAEKNELEVDEDFIMKMMARDVPSYKLHSSEVENKPEKGNDEPEPVHEETTKPVKRKQSRQIDFGETFLKEAKIKDRRQMYISGELYDRISAYLRIISEGKVSMVGYIHNVLAYHMLEFREMINELQKDMLNKISPL